MIYYEIISGVLGFAIFVLLSPRVKVLLAFFIMTVCFDLAPRIILNKDIWDFGAVLLLVAGVQLLFMKRQSTSYRAGFVTLLQIFIGWMLVCLLWSILIYGYPVLDTLKASRQMIIGFLSFFIFLRLFDTDQNAFNFFMKALYVGTFILLPITIAQYFIGRPLLFGLHREYGEVIRSLPVFLPICLLNFWFIASKLLTADRVAKHELLYAGMVTGVMVLTFTRGIYLAVLFVFCVMLIILTLNKRLNTRAATAFFSLSVLCVTVLLFGGMLDRVVARLASAVDVVTLEEVSKKGPDVDTFSDRLALTKERFILVAEQNPFIGFGFLHENNVPAKLRNKLRYGSPIATPEYLDKYRSGHPYVPAFYSADIGWAEMVIKTGILGLCIFLLLIVSFVIHYNKKETAVSVYHLRLGFFLQTLTLSLLMFNGSTFVGLVQIPSFMLAGYLYCSRVRYVAHSVDQSTVEAV